MDKFDHTKSDDFDELFVAIFNDQESFFTHDFIYPIDKDYEKDEKLSQKESLRELVKDQLLKSKIRKNQFSAFKIKFSTHYSFDYTIGY